MKNRLHDLSGRTYGHWTVNRLAGREKGRTEFFCTCGLCNREYRVAASNLVAGNTSCCKSCAARNLLDPANRAALRVGLETMWASDEYCDRVAQRDNTRQRKALKAAFADPDSIIRASVVMKAKRHKGPEWEGLSDDDILTIRADPRPLAEISKDYTMSEGMISNIKRRTSYAHIAGPPSVLSSKSPKVARKSLEEYIRIAEELVREHGFVPLRQWMIEHGHRILYDKLGHFPDVFGHLPRQMTYGEGDGILPTVRRARTGRFSDDEIRQIRRDTRHPDMIAREFGVTRQMIGYIQTRKQYCHVPDEEPITPS